MKDIFKTDSKTLIYDLAFLTMVFICISTFNKYNNRVNQISLSMIVGAAIVILIIKIFPIKNDENRSIYENKIALTPFVIIYSLLIVISFSMNKFWNLNNNTVCDFNIIYIRLLQLGILSTLFICHFFNVKLKDFNWNISIRSFILMILTFIILRLSVIFKEVLIGTININAIFTVKFVISTITNSIYPGIIEEVLYRGFLISGLKGIRLSEDKANVIQALLFGIIHVFGWGMPSWIFLLSTAGQALIGYVIGKIYFKTKSLTPCIIYHGIWDAFCGI